MTEEKFFSWLLHTMYMTRRNKRYGRDSIDFEADFAPRLIRMMRELQQKTFRVDHNYAFLVSSPRWREIFATCFEGRIADHLLCDTLAPYLDEVLHPRTFNNRIGKGAQAAINQVIEDICEVTHGYTRHARVIKWDLKGFFPSANLDIMEQMFHRLIDDYHDDISARFGDAEMPAFLRWLATVAIHCRPQEHCELRTPRRLWDEHIDPDKSLFPRPPGVGAPIGRLTSQMGMGLYMNDEVRWLNDECGVRATLFMDDCVMVVPENAHRMTLAMFGLLRKRLSAKGIRLNEKKFYDQPYQHGLEFLGRHIKPYRIHLNNKTYGRCIDRVKEFNKAPDKQRSIDRFISSVNSYTGLLKGCTDYGRTMKVAQTIDSVWLEYISWDDRRQCILHKPDSAVRRRLNQKYNLRLTIKRKRNDTSRNPSAAK